MNRRGFLAAIATATTAGCQSGGEDAPPTSGGSESSTSAASGTPTPQEPTPIYVDPDGSDGASGTAEQPLGSIQAALGQAKPGDTIQVRAGTYREPIEPPHGGEPGAPITITGPPDAVVRSHPAWYNPIIIRKSHVHIHGISIDGLEDPDNPERVDSYSEAQLIQVRPETNTDEYVEDIVLKPSRIGNTQKSLISLERTKNAEVGAFEVTGPAGAKYLYEDRDGHNGEFVYLGTAYNNLGTDWHPWEEMDETRNVHVHHVDNSAGHPHAELVDCKAGTRDVTIEYCTDAGGAASYLLEGADETSETAIHLGGNHLVCRWNRIEGSKGQAIEVGSWDATHPERFEEYNDMSLPEGGRDVGRDNEIYGNELLDSGGLAIQFPLVYGDEGAEVPDGYGPDAQTRVCGNTITGETHGDPESPCSDDVPTTETIGHQG